MTSQYDKNDDQLIRDVVELLWQRTRINMNDNIGVAHLGPRDYQDIYPTVTLTRDDIRNRTDRRSVRHAVIKKFSREFEEKGFQVTNTDMGLRIQVPEVRERGVTDFPNVAALQQANDERMRRYHASRSDYDTEEDFQSDNPDSDPYR